MDAFVQCVFCGGVAATAVSTFSQPECPIRRILLMRHFAGTARRERDTPSYIYIIYLYSIGDVVEGQPSRRRFQLIFFLFRGH